MDRTTSGRSYGRTPDAPEFVKFRYLMQVVCGPSACKCDSEMLDDTELPACGQFAHAMP